ncbi:unnamed protein product [Heterobilharzia americana]|nr:unnamed protein product [Heterobilharzia americana]
MNHVYSDNLKTNDPGASDEFSSRVTIPPSHRLESEHFEDEPPSPLSLQQDGVFSLVQSPPFENDQVDLISPENITSELSVDSKNQTLASLSEAGSAITDQTTEPICNTVVRTSDLHNMSRSEQANSISSDIPTLPCPGTRTSSQKTTTKCMINAEISKPDVPLTVTQTNLSVIASRKSVKELYGQPSWWGDGDNDYSYPHTSSFGNQDTVKPAIAFRKRSEETEVNSTSNKTSTRPAAEAFVIEFGASKPRSERPASLSGSLSQCIPPKLRQGLDERERKKREKQMEFRRQSSSGTMNKTTVTTSIVKCKPTTTVSKTTVNNVNAVQKTSHRGALSSAKSATARTSTTTKTTTNVTVTTTPSQPTITPNKYTRIPGTTVEKRNCNKPTPLLRIGRMDSKSNLTASSNNASKSNLTDRSAGRVSNQNSFKERTQMNRTNVRPPFSAGGRRISTGATSLASQHTAPSQLNNSRSKTSLTTRGSTAPVSNRCLASSRSNQRGSSSSATRQTITRGLGTTRGFMTPTTSSDAKQVRTRESIRSVPNESPISSSPKCNSRRTYESPIGNSAKKPITSTFLRRGTAHGRPGIGHKLSTDNINQYSSSNKSSTRISDLTASVVAAIEAYDDPKAYLFYRMFQGSEEIEATTDGIFQAFSTYSPNLPELNSRPLLNFESTNYEIDEPLAASQTNLADESKEHSSAASSNVRKKRSEPVILPDNNAKYRQGTTDYRTDSTTASKSWHKRIQENSQLSESEVHKNQIAPITSTTSGHVQGVIESYVSSGNKVHVEAVDGDVVDPMNMSLLVSTSVTSLTPSQTGTYVIDVDENTGDQCLSQHLDEKDVSFHKECDLSTPRGSPVREVKGDGQLKRPPGSNLSNQQSRKLSSHVKGFKNSMSSSVEQIQTCLPLSTLQNTRNKRLNSDHEAIPSSDLTKSQITEKSVHLLQTSSTVCLIEKLDDNQDENDILHVAGSWDDSDLLGASSISLTPSHTGTYVLDVDDTLAAQGVLPVVIHNHEALTSLARSGLNTTTRPESIRIHAAETLTPRGSPTATGKLWDVAETEEGNEDSLLVASNEVTGNMFTQLDERVRKSEILDEYDKELGAKFTIESLRAEFEDTYKLLPSPVQLLGASAVDSSFSESESRTSQMKSTVYPIHTMSTRSIPLINTSNTPVQYVACGVKSTPTNFNFVSSSCVQNNGIIYSQHNNTVSCTNNDGKNSNIRAYTNDSSSHQTSIGLKLPDRSSSNSSSNTPSTSSSYSNNASKYRTNLSNALDLNKQNIQRFVFMPNLNCNEESHSLCSYARRRNSESHEYSELLPNNIVTSTGNQFLNLSANIGNSHITIKRRDNRTTEDVHRFTGHTVMTTATTTTSIRHPDTMNQLLARLHSVPTSYKSRSNEIQNMVRTHSCNRRKSQYYPHGSASVPDPASPVRSWSSMSSGTEHSLTNRIVCRTRKQLRDQTDSGFIETSDAVKAVVSNNVLSQNSSSIFLGKKSENLTSPNIYNRNTLPQYDVDAQFKKSNEIDTRTYTRRKHSRSGDQNDQQKCWPSFDAESYQAWVSQMSELARGLNSLAREPLFQSDGSFEAETREECEESGSHMASRTITLPLLNNSQTIPTLPDSTTGPGVAELERSAFTTPLPHRSLEAMIAASNYRNQSVHQTQTVLNPDESMKVYLPVIKTGVDERVPPFIPSPQPFPLSPNFDPNSSDPNESAVYYSMMVDTIRYLSIKLRQFSDKLAHRLSHSQQQSTDGNNTELSSQQRRDDMQSSTKYALHDTLENMKAVNQQLQVVGKLLFSNDPHSELNNQVDSATSCEYLHKLEQLNQELHRFIPIEPATVHNSTIANEFVQLPFTNAQPVIKMTASKEQQRFGTVSTSVSSNNYTTDTATAGSTFNPQFSNSTIFTTNGHQPNLQTNSSDFMKMDQPYHSSTNTTPSTGKGLFHQTKPTSQHQHRYHTVTVRKNDNVGDFVKGFPNPSKDQNSAAISTAVTAHQTGIPPCSSSTTTAFSKQLLSDNVVYSADLPGVSFTTILASYNDNTKSEHELPDDEYY